MATTSTTQSTRNTADHARPSARSLSSTETKAAFKTTEFIFMIVVIAGILVSAALIKSGDSGGADGFVARQAWLYVAIVAGSYFISRGLAKSGSREPYETDSHR